MASTCSHQDSSRREVSSTAHLAAAARAIEKDLFIDPFAIHLGGEIGKDFLSKISSTGGDANAKNVSECVVIRTRYIDDYILNVLRLTMDSAIQIVSLGAGLDTRPWRLIIDKSQTNYNPKSIQYFEVYFQEIFDYKLPVLSTSGAEVINVYSYIGGIQKLSTEKTSYSSPLAFSS